MTKVSQFCLFKNRLNYYHCFLLNNIMLSSKYVIFFSTICVHLFIANKEFYLYLKVKISNRPCRNRRHI